ncbi:MAG TPA: class I SAM-dependent methyltransferase [Opitutales bacterium]|nr:class I SAM-dependent methyltransferase [Opitutales bacterium]
MSENADRKGSSRFDAGAAGWDANAARKAVSNANARVFGEIIASLPHKPDLFDYGCGTGQSILPVASKCRSVTGCDFSEPMLEKFRENAEAARVRNASTILCDLRTDPLPQGRYDMITCAMTLHHVADVAALVSTFSLLLRPGGTLALVDLEKEDGSFHEDHTTVAHFGFDKEEILAALRDAGFADAAVRTIHKVVKPRGTKMAEYPLFLATGKLA